MKTIMIGKKRRQRKPPVVFSSLVGMPTPVGWGEKIRPASQKGRLRLERGEIAFENIPVRIFPDKPLELPPIEDKVIGNLPDSAQRPILPVVEQSPEPEPLPPRGKALELEAEEINDYRYRGDSEFIREEYVEQTKLLSFRLIVSAAATLFLGVIEAFPLFTDNIPTMFSPELAPISYLALNIIMSLFCAVLCRSTIIAGLKQLKSRKFGGDALLSLASCAAVIQMVSELIWCVFVQRAGVARVCGAPLCFALFLNDLGLLLITLRSARNFRFVELRGIKSAVLLVGNDELQLDKLNAGGSRRAKVAYSVRTKFLSNYMDYSYEEDFCEHMMNRLCPYVAAAGLITGVVGGLVAASVWTGMFCFSAVTIIGTPVSRALCMNAPLGRSTKHLLKKGIMLNGWAAVDEFGGTKSFAVSSDALFPPGTVRLISVKSIGETPVDSAITAAAAVIIKAGGPLAQVFDDLLEGRRDMLPKAEGIEYENELGVAGWVDTKPVLVGNRKMLEMHGCEIPSKDYEKRIRRSDSLSAVYVAVSGRLAAIMLVEYSADEHTADGVRRMMEQGVNLTVYTCDPNVTAKLISVIYDVPQRMISILSTRAGSAYDELTHTIRDRAPAVLAVNGKLAELAYGIRECVRLKGQLMLSAVLQMACYALGLTLAVMLCCISGANDITPARMMILQLVYMLAALIPSIFS